MASVEKNCKWYFAPNVNFNVGPTDAAARNFDSSWDSFIRECIQNSLDAVLDPSKPVKVKLTFTSLPMKNYTSFLELEGHIKACLDTFPSAKRQYEPMLKFFSQINIGQRMGYLKISDYNTKGMAYVENDESCNFSAFVRGVGVHGGDQSAQGRGGSFGLGKSTIFMMSPFRTIFVSTLTNEGGRVFEGVTSLTTHNMGDEKLSHIGYYDNNNGLPVTDERYIPDRFLRRSEEDGVTLSGTDIYVMGRDKSDDDVEKIVKAVLTHYWLSILRRRLIVDIADSNDKITSIDDTNLDELMKSKFESGLDNARNSINPRPYYNAVVNADKTEGNVCIEKKLLRIGSVQLYLSKNSDAKKDRIAFFRLPCMMIMRKSTSQLMSIGNYGVYGVFVCNNPIGDALLKRLENAAHNEWNENNYVDPITLSINPVAKEAMDTIRKFLKESIEEFCKKKGKESLKMLGAGKYLYTYQDIVDTTEANSVDNPEVGIQAGEDVSENETGMRNSDVDVEVNVQDPPTTGNREGEVIDGSRGAKTGPGGEVTVVVTPPRKPRNTTEKKNQGGRKRVTGKPSDKPASTVVPVEYKVCANKEDGQIIHHVYIKTEIDVPKALIHFSSKGEDGRDDRELEIKESNVGTSKGMDLRGVHLSEGGNFLKLRFNDGAKHSLTISIKN